MTASAVRFVVSRSGRAASSVGLLVLGAALPARGQERERDGARDAVITFRADVVELDPNQQSVELRGGVDARCGGYVLHGERLTIRRSGDAVSLVGPASVVLCPCGEAPISLSFDGAELWEGGDLSLDNPTLRMGETPVFWLPWLWVRAPGRVGALPPRLAWRGDGGLLLGPGVRVPWTAADGSLSWMDLYVSGYTSGGYELATSVVTPTSRTTAALDRVDGDLVRLRSGGSVRAEHTGLGWHADLSRGERARTGLVDLREAAQRFDHGWAFLELRPWRSGFVHSGVIFAGERGGAHAIGPALFMDASGAVGSGVSWEAGAGLRVLGQPEATSQLASSLASVTLGHFWGPVRLSLNGYTSSSVITSGDASASEASMRATAEAALPLVRRVAALSHWVEPVVRATALGVARHHDGPASSMPWRSGQGGRWLAVAGLTTALGPAGSGAGGRLELALGELGGSGGSGGEERDRAASTRLTLRQGALGIDAQAAGVRRQDTIGAAVYARASAGDVESPRVFGELASRTPDLDTLDARVLSPAGSTWIPAGMFQAPGTSVRAGGHLPLGRGLMIGADSDWDAGEGQWLASGGGLLLEHPCRCASGRLWISRRLDRSGTDAWISLELR